VTLDTFKTEFLPTMERLVLRAPEIVFACMYSLAGITYNMDEVRIKHLMLSFLFSTCLVLVHLVKALSFDPSSIFSSSLRDPLLNGLRSTSESARTSSITLFKQLAQQCKEEEHVLKVVMEMTKLLTTGKISSPDHRGIFYDCLGKTAEAKSEAVAVKALQGLNTMTAKESNETAVAFGIDSTIAHLQVLLASGKDLPEVAATIKNGVTALGSTRASLRKTWARGMGDMIWKGKNPTFVDNRQNILGCLVRN
jgi:hypothetical protein